jgi:hypothetical protein
MKTFVPFIFALVSLLACTQQNLEEERHPPKAAPRSDFVDVNSKLRKMAKADAAIRVEFDSVFSSRNKSPEGKAAFTDVYKRMRVLDIAHHEILNTIVDKYGWIDSERFGQQASHDAWLIAQHMVHDKGVFQKKMLSLMKPGTNVDKTQYALLSDRIAVIFDKLPQIYGTQGKCQEDGDWKASPIKNFDTIDSRRLAIGFEGFAEYESRMDAKCLARTKQ